MKKHILYLILALAIQQLTFCTKKSDPAPVDNTPKGRLKFHLHTYVDLEEVDFYNSVYTSSNGRQISLSQAEMVISNIQLVRLDGSVYTVSGVTILKTLNNTAIDVADVPVGNYQTVRFYVGLDPKTNALPTTSSSSAYFPSLLFSTNGASQQTAFMVLSGKIDPSPNADGDESQMVNFNYKLGTDERYTMIAMPNKPFSITQGNAYFVHMIWDVSLLFSGIDLQDPNQLTMNTPAANANAVATQLANNLKGSFTYED